MPGPGGRGTLGQPSQRRNAAHRGRARARAAHRLPRARLGCSARADAVGRGTVFESAQHLFPDPLG
eukprot:583061-Prymnesium_polylepis.1